MTGSGFSKSLDPNPDSAKNLDSNPDLVIPGPEHWMYVHTCGFTLTVPKHENVDV
jgi:hypothetical protein